MAKCLVCETACRCSDSDDHDIYHVTCPLCGEYDLTDEAERNGHDGIDGFIQKHLYLLSAVARRSWKRGKPLTIDSELLHDRAEFESRILSLCPRRTPDKMNAILRYIAAESRCQGHPVRISPEIDYALLYCRHGTEAMFFLRSLKEQKLIALEEKGPDSTAALTAQGWIRVEELDRPNIESRQAFVAMWFGKQLDSAYTELLKLEEDTGFRMLRVDARPFNDKICDHIVAEIRRSRFMIADVTRHRRAVYFEAGYAMGLGLPVIWTCREDHMKRAERIFDTRQYNHIVWTTPKELRDKLRDRILATIG